MQQPRETRLLGIELNQLNKVVLLEQSSVLIIIATIAKVVPFFCAS